MDNKMRKKVVFVGTDLHKPLNESFSKQVHTILSNLNVESIVLSIENEKKPVKEKNFIILKKYKFRKIFQSIALFFYAIVFRLKGYKNFHFLMVPSTKVHKIFFSFLNVFGVNTIITLTRSEKRYFKNCENCKIIINNFDEN